MSIYVIKPGILSTVQDLGRIGVARFGINRNGAMDPVAARIANIIVGNSEADALLEMHFPAPELRFECDALIALTGADFSATLNDEGVRNWRPLIARKGTILKFDGKLLGNRGYLAVRGGIDADQWLGSRSTNLAVKAGGLAGRKLATGDLIRFGKQLVPPQILPRIGVSPSLIPRYSAFPTVRVTKGADFDLLSKRAGVGIFETNFTVSRQSNRMGYRLSGVPLEINPNKEMVSSAVAFGTIQRLPDGQLILLMADHQTSGGYPRIGHIIPTDLPLAAQLGANDKLAFYEVSLNDAEDALMRFERDLKVLRTACKFHFG